MLDIGCFFFLVWCSERVRKAVVMVVVVVVVVVCGVCGGGVW